MMLSLFSDKWEALSRIHGNAALEKSLFSPELIGDAFGRLLQQEDDPKYRICFFIDGLDEYTGDNVDYWALAKASVVGEKSDA